jgi:hypothetical protein
MSLVWSIPLMACLPLTASSERRCLYWNYFIPALKSCQIPAQIEDIDGLRGFDQCRAVGYVALLYIDTGLL